MSKLFQSKCLRSIRKSLRQSQWEEPTWVLACVAGRPHGGLWKCRFSEGRCSSGMLGFLDAGPLRLPVLISQCESNWENLTQPGNRKYNRFSITSVNLWRKKTTAELQLNDCLLCKNVPWSELVLAHKAAYTQVGSCWNGLTHSPNTWGSSL